MRTSEHWNTFLAIVMLGKLKPESNLTNNEGHFTSHPPSEPETCTNDR